MPFILIIAVLVIVMRHAQKVKKAIAARQLKAQARDARWEAASETEREAIRKEDGETEAAEFAQQVARRQKRRETNKATWKKVKWSVVILLGLSAVVAFLTFFELWHLLFLWLFFMGVSWFVYSLISDAVADGVRKGNRS